MPFFPPAPAWHADVSMRIGWRQNVARWEADMLHAHAADVETTLAGGWAKATAVWHANATHTVLGSGQVNTEGHWDVPRVIPVGPDAPPARQWGGTLLMRANPVAVGGWTTPLVAWGTKSVTNEAPPAEQQAGTDDLTVPHLDPDPISDPDSLKDQGLAEPL